MSVTRTLKGEEARAEELRLELEATRARLQEAEYLLEAIKSGKADALVISSPDGEEVYTLKNLELLVDSIIEHSLGSALVVDGSGKILRASPSTRDIHPGDLVGRPFDEAFPLTLVVEDGDPSPRSADGSAPAFRIGGILDGSSLASQEVAFTRPDGTSFSLLLAAKPLTLFGGLFNGAVVNLLDITPRKKAEVQLLVRNKQLKYQSELTKTITDNTAEALFLTDVEGRVLFMNPGAEEMLGWSLADILGKPLHHVLHPHHASDPMPSRSCTLGDLLATGFRVGVNEDTFIRADGKSLAVRYSKAPVIDEGRVTGAVLSIGDVSKRNETEAALKLSEEKLRQSQKMEAVGRLAGGIAHDFNNLLTAINGYASLGLDSVPAEDPLHGYLLEIHKAGERAASLTSQLLAYSRKQILSFKLLDMNHLVSDTSAILRRTLPETIRHELDLHAGPVLVKADPVHVQQVLLNLAINARDAMPEEGGVLSLSTGVASYETHDRRGLLGEMAREADSGITPGTYVRVTMVDNGHGMDENVKSHLFEPFFTTKEVGKGTGLGLSMAFGIVKQSGGHIQVFSEPGKGTTVNILLPFVRETAPSDPAPFQRSGRFQGSETVLLAEDEDSVLNLLRKVLEDQGYRVLVARSGGDALALAESFPGRIDLLVTDMVMNGMGGKELADALEQRRPETRRIFISGYTDDMLLRNGLDGRSTVFLQKPFSPEVLARTVRRTLDAAVG